MVASHGTYAPTVAERRGGDRDRWEHSPHRDDCDTGRGIRELERLRNAYGRGRWRKRKGVAIVRPPDGSLCIAKVHWHEAHGIGRKDLKIKTILGELK